MELYPLLAARDVAWSNSTDRGFKIYNRVEEEQKDSTMVREL